MPILYNFHIFLVTFYMIYWTNILIQCPVPVPVCCMFFVSQKIHIKRSPNAIKFYEELFWNICGFREVEPTQTEAHNPHDTSRRAPRAQARPGGLCPPRTSVGDLLKISVRSELRISWNIRNGLRPENRTVK